MLFWYFTMAQGGHSLVLNDFSRSSFNFTYSPVLILWVVTSLSLILCSRVVHVVFKSVISHVDFAMDAIIQQSVRKEMRRPASLVSGRVASSDVESSDSSTSGPAFSSRTVNRQSLLLNRIRNHVSLLG